MENTEETSYKSLIQIESIWLASQDLDLKELTSLLLDLLNKSEIKKYLEIEKERKLRGLSSMFG